jgi:hypothetical protein
VHSTYRCGSSIEDSCGDNALADGRDGRRCFALVQMQMGEGDES